MIFIWLIGKLINAIIFFGNIFIEALVFVIVFPFKLLILIITLGRINFFSNH